MFCVGYFVGSDASKEKFVRERVPGDWASVLRNGADRCGLLVAGRAADNSANDPEINNRLESLCLSVTEHALGGSGEELSLQFG